MLTDQTLEKKSYLETIPGGKEIELVPIPGGSFSRGKGEINTPSFFLGRYPVTNSQYLSFVEDTKSNYPEWMEAGNEYNIYTGTNDLYKRLGEALVSEDHPVVGINWLNAVAFCEWLSKRSGKTYRLPSEAEWEYAARGGRQSKGFKYAGSNKLKEVGWYNYNSHGATKPVGLKLPNELGLYDMSGNVREWCADHWHENYDGVQNDGSAWVTGGDQERRVVRGGSWFYFGNLCTVSFRFWNFADFRDLNIGFRIARY